MIEEAFKEIMRSNTGCAVVAAGSDSDRTHIEKIIKSLETYQVSYEVRIRSAHKQDVEQMVKEYNDVGGSYVIVAVAGGTDALSGQAAFHAYAMVISCPPDAPNDSCVNNPPGSSNVYLPNPKNVGKAVAQIYAGVNPVFRRLLAEKNEKKIDDLNLKDGEFRQKYSRYTYGGDQE